MLSMFEKLINEHGSSTILKERITLINDKYEILQTKLDLSEKENSQLKKDNEKLENKLKEYENQLSEQSNQIIKLPEIQISLLNVLFANTDGVDERLLAEKLNIDLGTLNYHTDKLLEKGLISHPGFIMGNSFTGESGSCEHYISKEGRKYLMEVVGT
ncbi:winged helix-turn-helix domain-containing protein [Psychromonas aquimarina]|uniref:winged helix-turn-helix domain-containing protein n=1 Tax=Psychromonas aquimarina TaxID=444919 RepID=UPI00041599CD|nr:winged helix-turn-helix domain-containing protein [Psychromonas aquimarina]